MTPAHRILVGAAAIAVAAAGCGADEPTSSESPDLPPLAPRVTASPDAPGVGFNDPDALTLSLLGPEDLPAGFIAEPDPVLDLGLPPAEPDESDASSTEPAVCAGVLSEIAVQRPGAIVASASRYTGPGFSSIDQDAASYRDSAVAATAFADLQDILAGCASYRGTDADGFAVDYTVGGREQGAGSSDTEGVPTVNFRVVTASEGFSLYSDVVIAAVGPTLVQLVATGPDPIEPAVLDDLTVTAIEKIAAGPPG